MLGKLLIANRGEIACRIMRTAQRLAIPTVAVYSDSDRNAMHTELADEAVYIGADPPRDSYLNSEALLAAAQRTGADAIHPGYGFLSENPEFCQRCLDQQLIFVGPTVQAIEQMGSKARAKQVMEAAGVPSVPGYHGADQTDTTLLQEACTIGFPVMLKASAGGGGKGMRIATDPDQFSAALSGARREAEQSFGNTRLLLEKAIDRPRHVEVQVFCDHYGNAVYLFDRDCSIQRRHQKIFEEAPAPNLSEGLRQSMGEVAINAARAIAYRGAGTVEFLLDRNNCFYFMEMNTRLQVEHGVTELISNQDLVEWQLRIAAGETLPLTQAELQVRGHAVEVRIYAEDPQQDFLPQAGTISYLRAPRPAAHLRIDTGIREGDTVSIHYDPLIAKLMAWGESRDIALQRLRNALENYRITGLRTNLDFLLQLARSSHLALAELDTTFVERHGAGLLAGPATQRREPDWIALAGLYLHLRGRPAPDPERPLSPWQLSDQWRLNQPTRCTYQLIHGGITYEIQVEELPGPQRFAVSIDSGQHIHARSELRGSQLWAEIDGYRLSGDIIQDGANYHVYLPACHIEFSLPLEDTGESDGPEHEGQLSAPMNGRIVDLMVTEQSTVSAGQPLLILEAMKMEHTIRAPRKGLLTRFRCQAGELVEAGQQLLELEAINEGDT